MGKSDSLEFRRKILIMSKIGKIGLKWVKVTVWDF